MQYSSKNKKYISGDTSDVSYVSISTASGIVAYARIYMAKVKLGFIK